MSRARRRRALFASKFFEKMKKHILVYGLIAGSLFIPNMVYLVFQIGRNPDFEGNMILGFAIMFAVFSLIFFGVRDYRDKLAGGSISFWDALKMGAAIAFIASVVYVAAWAVGYHFFAPDFLEQYAAHVLAKTPADELAAKTAEMADLKKMYASPLGFTGVTMMEVLPVGLVVAAVSAFFLRKK